MTPRPVPYVEGGNERHWDALVEALRADGLDADLIAVDTPETSFAEVIAAYRRFLDLDLSAYDVVISGKYPSYLVNHPRHIRHLNHPLRGLYEKYPDRLPSVSDEQFAHIARLAERGPHELLDWAESELERTGAAPGQPLPAGVSREERALFAWPGPMAQAVVWALDAQASRRLTAQTVVSETVASRAPYQALLFPPGVPLSVIEPLTTLQHEPTGPLPDEIGAYFLTFGRLSADKRFDLIIEAFRRSGLGEGPSPYELWIAGDGEDRSRLSLLASVVPGVELLGFCSDDDLAHYLGRAAAVVLTPSDEDYGLVAAEAQAAGRPVLTVSDSGGIAEQVIGQDGVDASGISVAPHAGALAAGMRLIADKPGNADRLGRLGRDRVGSLSWQPLIDLVRATARPVAKPGPNVLILSTYPAEPVHNGGARRLRAVAHSLQSDLGATHASAQVTVLALTNKVAPGEVRRRRLHDGVIQILVGRSAAQLRADHEMASFAGVPVDDIGASVLHSTSPEFGAELEQQQASADLIVLAHPFLAPALTGRFETPVVYDAHNVEIDLKASLLQGHPGRDELVAWCEEAEASALRLATVVAATSEQDSARLCPPGCGHRRVLAPNGVDPHLIDDRLLPRHDARGRVLADLELPADDERPMVVFVGSNHGPNQAAADRLAAVGASRPDLLVVIAGAVSTKRRPGASSYGRISDQSLARLLRAADINVNPVTSGSGTNIKLIEALAAGVPSVSTVAGARGLPDPDAVLWLSGAESADLAATIDRLLADPHRTAVRVRQGLDLAQGMTWHETLGDLRSAIREQLGLLLAT